MPYQYPAYAPVQYYLHYIICYIRIKKHKRPNELKAFIEMSVESPVEYVTMIGLLRKLTVQ